MSSRIIKGNSSDLHGSTKEALISSFVPGVAAGSLSRIPILCSAIGASIHDSGEVPGTWFSSQSDASALENRAYWVLVCIVRVLSCG